MHLNLSLSSLFFIADGSCPNGGTQLRCLPVNVDVVVRHSEELPSGQITYDLLSFREEITSSIKSFFDASYVGEVTTSANMKVTLDAKVSVSEMNEVQIAAYEASAKDFLQESLADGPLKILKVRIVGQSITTNKRRRLLTWWQTSERALADIVSSVEIDTEVLAEYRPPPDLKFTEVLDDTVSQNTQLLSEKVKESDPYFEEFEEVTIETVQPEGAGSTEDFVPTPKNSWYSVFTDTIWAPIVAGFVGSALIAIVVCRLRRRRVGERSSDSAYDDLIPDEGYLNLKADDLGGLGAWFANLFGKKKNRPTLRGSGSSWSKNGRGRKKKKKTKRGVLGKGRKSRVDSILGVHDSDGKLWAALPLANANKLELTDADDITDDFDNNAYADQQGEAFEAFWEENDPTLARNLSARNARRAFQ